MYRQMIQKSRLDRNYGNIPKCGILYTRLTLHPLVNKPSLSLPSVLISSTLTPFSTMPPKQPPKPQMYRHDDRVESFNPILKPKARARHAWPHSPDTHPLLTPENMALAGFYFLAGQSTVTSDTCVCFLCGVSLGGWAEDDDPHKEHLERGDCAWAETICQAEVDKRSAKGKGKSV